MTFVLDRSENRCTKYKWLAKSPEAQQIVGRSAELEKMKDKNLKFGKGLQRYGERKTIRLIKKGTEKSPKTEE